MQKIIPVLMWIVLWAVVASCIVRHDGICRGVCSGCVYQGWCPQERK